VQAARVVLVGPNSWERQWLKAWIEAAKKRANTSFHPDQAWWHVGEPRLHLAA
jgi:hypothetical protein